MLRFAQSKPECLVVGTNLALKRLTYHMRALRAALFESAVGVEKLLEAAREPIFIDVGTAAYGAPADADGSDGMLLAMRFAEAHVPVSVHSFEMLLRCSMTWRSG